VLTIQEKANDLQVPHLVSVMMQQQRRCVTDAGCARRAAQRAWAKQFSEGEKVLGWPSHLFESFIIVVRRLPACLPRLLDRGCEAPRPHCDGAHTRPLAPDLLARPAGRACRRGGEVSGRRAGPGEPRCGRAPGAPSPNSLAVREG
jgi:hypothetical protein